jgi:hypothetical protein
VVVDSHVPYSGIYPCDKGCPTVNGTTTNTIHMAVALVSSLTMIASAHYHVRMRRFSRVCSTLAMLVMIGFALVIVFCKLNRLLIVVSVYDYWTICCIFAPNIGIASTNYTGDNVFMANRGVVFGTSFKQQSEEIERHTKYFV